VRIFVVADVESAARVDITQTRCCAESDKRPRRTSTGARRFDLRVELIVRPRYIWSRSTLLSS